MPPGVMVRVLLELVTAGLNAAVTPLGSPEMARFTLPLNPFWPVTVIVRPSPFPRMIRPRVLAEDVMLKLGPGLARTMIGLLKIAAVTNARQVAAKTFNRLNSRRGVLVVCEIGTDMIHFLSR